MKRLVAVALIFVGSSAFAHGKMPSCKSLINNTEGIVTLRPITSANDPIQAGENLIFAATTEGVDAGFCAARVTVHAGQLIVGGIEKALHTGKCIVEGAAGLVDRILHDIFG